MRRPQHDFTFMNSASGLIEITECQAISDSGTSGNMKLTAMKYKIYFMVEIPGEMYIVHATLPFKT